MPLKIESLLARARRKDTEGLAAAYDLRIVIRDSADELVALFKAVAAYEKVSETGDFDVTVLAQYHMFEALAALTKRAEWREQGE